jgi:hypothetical protein
MGNLKFCFANKNEKEEPLSFIVNFKLIGYAPYGTSQDNIILHVQFLNRPPDELILIIGEVLDADANASRRRSERITVTSEIQKKLNLV